MQVGRAARDLEIADVAHERDVRVVDGDGQFRLIVERGRGRILRRRCATAGDAVRAAGPRGSKGPTAPIARTSGANQNRADMGRLLWMSGPPRRGRRARPAVLRTEPLGILAGALKRGSDPGRAAVGRAEEFGRPRSTPTRCGRPSARTADKSVISGNATRRQLRPSVDSSTTPPRPTTQQTDAEGRGAGRELGRAARGHGFPRRAAVRGTLDKRNPARRQRTDESGDTISTRPTSGPAATEDNGAADRARALDLSAGAVGGAAAAGPAKAAGARSSFFRF